MDWTESQVPPPSWHDEGEIIPNGPGDESYCPLTSMVRRCYLKHLEQTLIQNYESCRTKTIQQSTLRDFILHWEQNALRACMMTAVYQRAMLQVINAIKSDTKENRLASVLTASVKKLKSYHSIDVSTQTDAVTPTENGSSMINGNTPTKSYSAKRKSVRQPSLNKESSVGSSDGPFLTPPSDYPPPNMQTTKNCLRTFPQRDPMYPSPVAAVEQNPSFQIPVHFTVPPPCYPPLPQNPYSQVITMNNWACEPENNFAVLMSTACHADAVSSTPATQEPSVTLSGHEMYDGQNPQAQSNEGNSTNISLFNLADAQSTNDSHCNGGNLAFSNQLPQTTDINLCQMQTCDTERVEDMPNGQINCKVEESPNYRDVQFTLGLSDVPEPDYNWAQIEEEMARLCGQVFTEVDSHNTVEKPESKILALPVPEPQNNWEILATLHEEELEYKLEQLRTKWSLQKQANLKHKFIELFGKDENENDQSTQISARETSKCRQRIVPWVVKHLMPLYRQKRIANRQVFKSLAKHIADLLIQRNLHPDECDVWMGVQEFFGSGITIECEADFCA